MDTHTGTATASLSLWMVGCQGSLGLGSRGSPRGGKESPLSTGVSPPHQHRGSERKRPPWLSHTRGGQTPPLAGRRCHFVSFQEGSPQVTTVECPPGPPTPGHVTCELPALATEERTILPRFLCKVTLGAGTQLPAALGAKAHSRPGAGSGSRNSGPGASGHLRPGALEAATSGLDQARKHRADP